MPAELGEGGAPTDGGNWLTERPNDLLDLQKAFPAWYISLRVDGSWAARRYGGDDDNGWVSAQNGLALREEIEKQSHRTSLSDIAVVPTEDRGETDLPVEPREMSRTRRLLARLGISRSVEPYPEQPETTVEWVKKLGNEQQDITATEPAETLIQPTLAKRVTDEKLLGEMRTYLRNRALAGGNMDLEILKTNLDALRAVAQESAPANTDLASLRAQFPGLPIVADITGKIERWVAQDNRGTKVSASNPEALRTKILARLEYQKHL